VNEGRIFDTTPLEVMMLDFDGTPLFMVEDACIHTQVAWQWHMVFKWKSTTVKYQ